MLDRIFPDARLTAEANLLIMPNLDAANITFNAVKIVAGRGISVGPILFLRECADTAAASKDWHIDVADAPGLSPCESI